MLIILFGPPGSGKGTVAEFIHEKYNYPILASGELLRKEMAQKNTIGKQVSAFISAGELVPDPLINSIIEKEINELEPDIPFILDGYPRTLNQAVALDQQMKKESLVFYLDIPKDILMERLLKRGRADDTKDIIENRFAVYQEETEPLIRYYRKSHRLIAINEKSSKKVFQKIEPFLETPIP